MRFAPPQRRPRGESIVAMVNIVFLLLVFFLLTSRIAPPDPIEVLPPLADQTGSAEDATALFVSAEGALALGAFRDAAALEAVAPGPLLVVADAEADGAEMARLFASLAARGVTEIQLVTQARAP